MELREAFAVTMLILIGVVCVFGLIPAIRKALKE